MAVIHHLQLLNQELISNLILFKYKLHIQGNIILSYIYVLSLNISIQ